MGPSRKTSSWAAHRLSARLTGLAAVVLAVAGPQLLAHAAGHRHPAARGHLFQRQPFSFGWGTLDQLGHWAGSLQRRLPHLIAQSGAEMLWLTGAALLLLAGAIAWTVAGRRRFTAWIELETAAMTARAPAPAAPWLFALACVGASVSLPLALWLLHSFVSELSGYEAPLFLILGSLLEAWTLYALTVSAIHELVMRPLLDVSRENGRYLWGCGRWMLLYWLLAMVLLDSAVRLGAPHDVVALFHSLFQLSLIVLLGTFFARRRAIMALFPAIPSLFYQRFLDGLDWVYPLALMLTVGIALLQWAGFRRLADFVWLRTWALAAVFLAAIVIHHLLRLGLRRWVVDETVADERAQNFYRSAVRWLDYLVLLAVLLVALRLTGLSEPLYGALSERFGSIGNHPLSALVFMEGAAIIAGFVLFAGLLRDYLEFRVYPALNVDEGVAHAIDTFIVYAFAIVGFLAALEAVGLGIATITLFAGALGIGAGFGLQSIANNLASGLTLIFGRTLRKGDWVTIGDTIGVVQEVGVRTTRLRTRDDVEYFIPNAEFVGGRIVNWTRSSPYARLHVPLGVSYGTDPARVRQVLERVAGQTPNVRQHPAPEVWFVGFGDSSLNFELLVWINVREHSRHRLASDLYFAIFTAFKEAGIEIPFPQRDIHIRSADALARLETHSR